MGLKSAVASITAEQLIEHTKKRAKTYWPFIKGSFNTIFLPLFFGVAIALLSPSLFKYLYRLIYPLDAAQLHKEAMGIMKKGDAGNRSRSKTKSLLEKSIQLDPQFLPSYLSLAAIQLYHNEDHEGALATIHDALKYVPVFLKNEKDELLSMRDDAKAMASNLGHMVIAGSFANPHMGDYCYPSSYRR